MVSLFLGLFASHGGVLGHAEKTWCHFQNLIGGQVLDTSVKRHFNGSDKASRNALVGRAHVGQCLGLAHIDFQVTWSLMNADNHALVALVTRLDEHFTTLLGSFNTKCCYLTISKGQDCKYMHEEVFCETRCRARKILGPSRFHCTYEIPCHAPGFRPESWPGTSQRRCR